MRTYVEPIRFQKFLENVPKAKNKDAQSTLIFVFSIFFLMTTLQSSPAATFSRGGDEGLNCILTLEGPIVSGDAQRLREFLRTNLDLIEYERIAEFGEKRICLDSPGGSFVEAIEIADLLLFGVGRHEITRGISGVQFIPQTLGTAISSGAECLSACSIIFMAGGYFNGVTAADNLRHPDRNLHIDGVLGFHAPYVALPSGEYSEAAVTDAFSAASEIISQLTERRRYSHFSSDLISRMLSTGPQEMFYVDTIGKAASYAINLVGAPSLVFDRENYSALGLACRNLSMYSYLGVNDGPEMYQNLLPENIRQGNSLGWMRDNPVLSDPSEVEISSFSEIDELPGAHEYRYSLAMVHYYYNEALEDASEESPLVFYSSDCNLAAIGQNQRILGARARPLNDLNLIYGNNQFSTTVEDNDWWFFPGSLNLSELSELGDLYPRGVPASQWAPVIVDVYHPECFISRAGDAFVVYPCVVTINQARTFDLVETDYWISLEVPGASIGQLIFEFGGFGEEEVIVESHGWNYLPRLNDLSRAGFEDPRAELCFEHETSDMTVCLNRYEFNSVRIGTNAPPPFR